jgi:hypothetical protein
MANTKINAFEITNLVLNDESSAVNDKYLIRSDNIKKIFPVPLELGGFTNIYLGVEHDYSCEKPYEELDI